MIVFKADNVNNYKGKLLLTGVVKDKSDIKGEFRVLVEPDGYFEGIGTRKDGFTYKVEHYDVLIEGFPKGHKIIVFFQEDYSFSFRLFTPKHLPDSEQEIDVPFARRTISDSRAWHKALTREIKRVLNRVNKK